MEKFSRRVGMNGGVDRAIVKLPYTYRNTFTMTGISDIAIKLNSILDCGTGSDTDNAQGYNLYYSYFTRSRVHASSITLTVNNSDLTEWHEPVQCVLIPCTASNLAIMQASTDWMAQINNAHAKSMVVFDGKGRTTLKHYCDVGTLVGYKSFPLSSSFGAFAGSPGVDPTQLLSWYVGFSQLSGTTSLDIQYQIRVTYYVEFTDPVYEADQELTRRTVLGNDFAGTKEEYEKYKAAHAKPRQHLNRPKKDPKEEKKETLSLQASEPEEFDLVKVPKKSATSSKK